MLCFLQLCGLKWSPDDRELASGGNDNQLNIWNSSSTTPVLRFQEHLAAVKAISWSPHQQGLLASGGGTADRCIRFWNTATGSQINSIDTGEALWMFNASFFFCWCTWHTSPLYLQLCSCLMCHVAIFIPVLPYPKFQPTFCSRRLVMVLLFEKRELGPKILRLLRQLMATQIMKKPRNNSKFQDIDKWP